MKKLVFAAIIICQTNLFSQKIAFVDIDDLTSQLPDVRLELTKLNKLKSVWVKDLDQRKEKYYLMKSTYESTKSMMAEELVISKQKELEVLYKEWQSANEQYFGANGDYNRKYKENMQMYNGKIRDAIQYLGKQNGYDVVYEKRTGELLYSSPAADITGQVFEYLAPNPQNTAK